MGIALSSCWSWNVFILLPLFMYSLDCLHSALLIVPTPQWCCNHQDWWIRSTACSIYILTSLMALAISLHLHPLLWQFSLHLIMLWLIISTIDRSDQQIALPLPQLLQQLSLHIFPLSLTALLPSPFTPTALPLPYPLSLFSQLSHCKSFWHNAPHKGWLYQQLPPPLFIFFP